MNANETAADSSAAGVDESGRESARQETPPADTADARPPQPESENAGPAEPPQPDLQAELEKYKDLALRAHAELDNFRKRAAREKDEAVRFANARLLEAALPILDSFDLGFQSAREAREAAAVVAGFEMVRRQFADWLRDAGVETVAAEGAVFDPGRHEAVGQEPSASVPQGAVLRQLRPGYILRGRLLRPASVIVSSGPDSTP